MNVATTNLVIACVWAGLAVLLVMFLTAIVRAPAELTVAGPDQSAALAPVSVARYGRMPYVGRHAHGRTGQVSTGPPWDPAPEPRGLPR